jgi:hypothetical protein
LALLFAALTLAATPAEGLAKVDEAARFRSMRMAQGVPPVPRPAYQEALDGRIATGLEAHPTMSAKKAWGVAVLNVNIKKLAAAINDDRSKLEYTRLAYAEIVKGAWCESGRSVFQFIKVPMLTSRWLISHPTWNKPIELASGGLVRELVFKSSVHDRVSSPTITSYREKGIPVGFSDGAWLLVDLGGGRTLVEYYVWSDPGGSVPQGLVNSLASKGVRETISAIETIAKAGPKCPVE